MLQSMGSQRVEHDSATEQQQHVALRAICELLMKCMSNARHSLAHMSINHSNDNDNHNNDVDVIVLVRLQMIETQVKPD